MEKKKAPSEEGALLLYKTDNIFNPTVKCIAQRIQSLRADRFSLFNPIQGVGRKALLIYQIVLRNVLPEQSLVKRFVADHRHHREHNIMLNRLTMPNKLSIIGAKEETV